MRSDIDIAKIAATLLYDIARAVDIDIAIAIYNNFRRSSHSGVVSKHLCDAFATAQGCFGSGNRSAAACNLYAVAEIYDRDRDEDAIAEKFGNTVARRRRQASSWLPEPPPDLVAAFSKTASLHGLPLPADAHLIEYTGHSWRYRTNVANVLEVSGLYQHTMIADGWTFDWGNSSVDADRNLLQRGRYHTKAIYARLTDPIQCVHVTVEADGDAAATIQLEEIFEDEPPKPYPWIQKS